MQGPAASRPRARLVRNARSSKKPFSLSARLAINSLRSGSHAPPTDRDRVHEPTLPGPFVTVAREFMLLVQVR